MTMTAKQADGGDGGKPAGAADEELVRQLAEQARAEGVSLTGPGGLLGRLTKVVLESALEGEMDAHLGYRKHDPAGDGSGNSRNGHRDKTVLTEAGPGAGQRAAGPRRLVRAEDRAQAGPAAGRDR